LGANPQRVRCWLWRSAATALAVAAVLSLCAVGFVGSAEAGFFSDATSRLFGRGSTRMDLAPIVGAPPNVAKELAQDLVSAGKDNHLTLTPDGTGSPYTLRGYLVATSEKKGAKISYILDIADTNAKLGCKQADFPCVRGWLKFIEGNGHGVSVWPLALIFTCHLRFRSKRVPKHVAPLNRRS
jgi:hypothetical protein